MPFVINGVGTWYYGKKRIHTIRETCEFCNRQTDLSSYDTTLFFVVAFIPLIPIRRLRVLRSCAVCQKHRLISLAKWEAAKSSDSGELLEALKSDPDNRETIMRAIRFSMAYQDEPLFNNTVEALAAARTDDAEIQTLLGHGYSYFSRWPEAGEAFEAAVQAGDSEERRESLAWALLKQDRPDEAKPWLQHVLDNKKRDAAGMVYHLVKGYQAQGRHEEALEIMDERDKVFPEWASLKEYTEQRKTSTRYRGSGKKVASAALSSPNTGYREGNWTSNWPRWVAASVVLGAIAFYLGSAFWIGKNRKVYFVNGTNKPYAVVVGGERHNLTPHAAMPIRVAEGDVEVAFGDDKPGLEPVRCRIETSFWGRPFANRTFVINPDESAVILEEETYYAKNNPPASRKPTIHFGNSHYEMSGIDYEFEEFPQTLQVKKSTEVRKTGVFLFSAIAPEEYAEMVEGLEPNRQAGFCQKLLRLDPGETIFLHWMASRLPSEETMRFVETRLADRPILVEWHRVFQSMMEQLHPETDLRPRYRLLVAETNSNPEALYLLGRCDPDPVESDKLYRQSATAAVPSGYAFYSLGYRALSEGKFPEAVQWFQKAFESLADKTLVRRLRQESLLASGDYDALLNSLQQDMVLPGRRRESQMQMLRVNAIRGDKARTTQVIADVMRDCAPDQRVAMQQILDSLVCCCQNDVGGYLRRNSGKPSFETAFLEGQPVRAAELAKSARFPTGVVLGLLWLEASLAGKKEIAEAHFNKLLDELKKAGRDERLFGEVLAGRQPAEAEHAERIHIEPSAKRVLLAVLAKRQPARSAELLALAKKLDFQHDAISLCLAKYLQKS
ncbi:tetratricopeptide repeat protein [Zavarzinella formosa]|uniref:hypothetical protein n=1 Tax=Zavarzinella formosa TaxID=360055 RepID=UPI00030C86C6|nr:hypothetical protein [Zavarzinella formosa]